MKKFTFLFILLSSLIGLTFGQTNWYVSEDGDDGTGNGSADTPWVGC